MINRVIEFMALRALSLLTLLALLLVGAGIAAKTDVATAAIVCGAILLIDLEVSSLKGAPK